MIGTSVTKELTIFTKKSPSDMLCRALNGTKYSRMDQVKFVEDSL